MKFANILKIEYNTDLSGRIYTSYVELEDK